LQKEKRVFLRYRAALACIAIAAILGACGGDAGRSIPPQHVRPAESQQLSSRTLRLSGTAAGAELSPDGALRIDLGGAGHVIEVEPVSGAAMQYRIRFDRKPSRRAMSVIGQPDCYDACGDFGGGTPTPVPTPTPPPNYAQCSKAGGATWYDNLNGSYGCVKQGGQQQLSCGILKWDFPGHGRLFFSNGQDLGNIDYAIDHGESGCTLG
jgi:hypothetical protein